MTALEQCKKLTFTRVSKPLPEAERIKRLENEPLRKRCSKCERYRPIKMFRKYIDRRTMTEKRYYKCNDCTADYQRKYLDNPVNAKRKAEYDTEYKKKMRGREWLA